MSGCPYCNIEQCSISEKDKCQCEDFQKCPNYLEFEAEKGDGIWQAIDKWEDEMCI